MQARFQLYLSPLITAGALCCSMAHAEEPPTELQGYYEKRVSIVGYPMPTVALETDQAVLDTKSVLQSLRMTGVSYAGMSPAHADEAAKTFQAQGFNAVIGGGHRYLFSDTLDEKLATNVVCGGTYEQLLRDAKMMSEACHRHGLKFFLHQTSTMVDASLIARHPEWSTVDLATGKPYQNAYGTANTCLNNDDFMSEYFRRLEKLLSEAGADGLLADEIQFFGPTLCGCELCREKFRDDTGLTIPANGSLSGWLYDFTGKSSYAKWLAWRRERVTQTLKQIKTLVVNTDPDGVLINYLANPAAAAPYYMAGYTIDDFTKHSDVVGYECEPPRMQSVYYSPLIIAEMKYQRAVAESMRTGTFRLAYSASPGEHLWDWCLTKSQGAGYWWLVRDEQSSNVSQPLVAWDARFESLDRNLESAAEIGVLFSLDSRDRSPHMTNPRTSWLRGYLATCAALTDGHVPYKALVDQDLTRDTLKDKVRTLILCNTDSMSDEAIVAVREFVRGGGTLVATSRTSLGDEHGQPRADFGLADVFGFRHEGESSAPNKLTIDQSFPLIGSVVGSLTHDAPFQLLKNISPDVQTLGRMTLSDATSHPGILSRSFGQGRVVYFSGHPELQYQHWSPGDTPIEAGKHWTDRRDPQYGKLLCAAALGGEAAPLTIENLPAGVVAETFRHEYGELQGLQVRFANLVGGRLKTGAVPVWYGVTFPDLQDRLPQPQHPIRVSARITGVRQVFLISPDYDAIVSLPFVIQGDQVSVTIPTVHRYSMLYFEQAGDVASHCHAMVVKSIPSARQLATEESLPLVGAYDPDSVTVFAGSESLSGGSEASLYLGEMSRFIYGSDSSLTKFTATLDVPRQMTAPQLEIGGMDAVAPLRIRLNGKTIFEGSAEFGSRWTVKHFALPPASVLVGENSLEIENTGKGAVSTVPWFGVAFVKLKDKP